jgi:hypothetical protein
MTLELATPRELAGHVGDRPRVQILTTRRRTAMANAAAAKAPPRPMSADMAQRIERLLKGAIDMHCHSGLSVMPRRLDHIDAVEEAAAAGMKALLFKDHYYSATPITELLKGRCAGLLGLDEPRRDA